MVGWYDPAQLVRTGLAVAASTLFGRHADYRLMEALAAPKGHLDEPPFSDGQDFWIDYVADIGDGWNSTYAVAYELAQPRLDLTDPDGVEYRTERGSVLILGGDGVYPIAGRTQYKERTVAPYEAALPTTDAPHPLVRAVPGNHDWYDSLVAFTRLFSTRSFFAGWRAKQAASYFAIKLPHGWWLLGTDVQLDSDIDQPQIEYFKDIATTKMRAGDRIILCNAEPHWIYAHIYGEADPDYNENNLAFLEDKVLGKDKKVAVFLAGDLHHYRRHEGSDGTHKITAGGGGAFLHPTHGPDVSRLAGDFTLRGEFPKRKDSQRMGWRNLLFLKRNPWFGVVPGILYTLTAWAALTDISGFGIRDFGAALCAAINATLNHPIAAYWGALVFSGFFLFTDTHSTIYRYVAGFLHGSAHLFAVFLIGWGATYLTVNGFHLDFGSTGQLLVVAPIIVAGGWIAGSIIMGLYLLVSLNVFKRHSNEAFSSLKVEDWKNFLRMKIDRAGRLTIYPIGMRRVARKWAARPPGGTGSEWIPDDPKSTRPELIETPFTANARSPASSP
jgi:hypothetical protein